ncbi:Abortive infection bacteriophage resistance protein [Arthrobacter alpinus]|uniref:Abortive infection bacteriophage resistance protein n=1 Tax=Arthrobacter alpinus TaxID=656366 RepID=A0A1H5GSI1_9MICC|nr:Abi family protein [Arthrobacter alpinus]SEE18637.1 Abortive infection bacteriophage resistance protein [Arthrobacter alpinus]
MTEYDRPHLSFEEQVAILESRGLDCSGCDAPSSLAKVGYYRLSAYTYPFRKPLEPGDSEETPIQFRSAEFSAGYKLSDALKLYDFDNSLRLLCTEAMKVVEIGLRVQIAYVLGRRDRFGYLNRESLDERACNREAPDGDGDMFDYWRRRYDRLKRQAAAEDFVRHYMLKYDGRLPIWVAVEVLDFGGVIRLFSLLNRNDQNEIARTWGVNDGRRLHKWLLNLGTVRNICAHHSRLWNRVLNYEIAKFPPSIVDPELTHIAEHIFPKKLYPSLAVLAYLVPRMDARTNWPRTLRTKIKLKFPSLIGISPEENMGFPSGWDELPLWNYSPPK